MGSKRGRGRGSFIDSVLDLVDTFYVDVVQHLKAWAAAPPRMRENESDATQPSSLSSTALSSQDGAEPVEDPAAPKDANLATTHSDEPSGQEPIEADSEPASLPADVTELRRWN